jgi:hypothetical protein
VRFLLLLLFLGACQAKESVELVKEVSTELRPKARVQVIVRSEEEDLALRKQIEDRIEQEGIGRVVSSGAGSGQIDITVEVDNTAEAIPRIRKIALELGVLPKTTYRIL